MTNRLELRAGLRIEHLGDEVILLDPAGEVHRVTGPGVEALVLVAGGVEPRDVPDELAESVDALVAAGVVAEPRGWARRRMLMASGATLASATVVTFALADPAAAASGCGSGIVPTDRTAVGVKYTTVGTVQYVTRAGQTSVLVRAWGGGGGGGAGRYNGGWYPGGGGGGGAYASSPAVAVSPCTSYTVTVGAGGDNGAVHGGAGANGGQSLFKDGSTVMAQFGSGGAGGATGGGNTGGGSGGSGATSIGSTKYSGGAGGHRGTSTLGGASGGGSASHGGDGSPGLQGTYGTRTGGSGGAAGGTIAGGAGGNGFYNGTGGNGAAPGGGGGGGGSGPDNGGDGARGEVWVGI